MKQKIKILAVLTAGMISSNALALQQTLTGTFNTIQAVDIQPFNGGLVMAGLNLTAGSQCILAASTDGTGTGYLGDQAMRIGGITANAAGSTISTTTGVGCLGSSSGGTIGTFEITGAPGATVNVTITDGANADLLLTPSGCVANYIAGANGDTCVIVNEATPASIRLAGPTDTGTLGEGTPISGTALVALGGIAEAARQLDPSVPYTVDFQIDVTY
ncbi:hypothetical protein [Paraglaciecola hydrolytica]|uniref:Spore coat protein U domain-containing protein n=1 Tax=Paraglaciecola hydrolytica TaxID=1799789 RepID=A0A148KMY7_9ALTE|nr:hypothetical protein [Paraglaciecola hydrolytica]KXI27657.1 hypothetical protein AX660_19055 [Paraglaciecola hydrolytica]